MNLSFRKSAFPLVLLALAGCSGARGTAKPVASSGLPSRSRALANSPKRALR